VLDFKVNKLPAYALPSYSRKNTHTEKFSPAGRAPASLFCRHAVTFSAEPTSAWVSTFREKKSSRNETLQILRASAQKIPRHGSETQSAMPLIESGGVAAKRLFFLGGCGCEVFTFYEKLN